jgi:cyclophilin family peptidyl-prolyl cis-trans isomerase
MRTSLTIFCVVCMILLSGALGATRFSRWSTSMGNFTAELYDQETPITAGNFVSLANSGFYNGLIFHRVVEGFVIQDGCPYGTGYGGPGYTIPDEIYPGFHHDQAGILAMARTSAPNSAGSQYYITLAPAPHLDGNYAIFGKVVQGLDVVLAIGQVPVDANDHPVTPVNIDTLRVLDLAIGTITPDNSAMVHCLSEETQMFIVEAFADHSPLQFAWYKDGVLVANAVDFIFETQFTTGIHTLECVASSADWSHTVHWDIYAYSSPTDDQTIPGICDLSVYPNPFHDSIRITVRANGIDTIPVVVYDIRGRKVYSAKTSGQETGVLQWDGKDMAGKRCPAGVYIIKSGRLSTRCMMF